MRTFTSVADYRWLLGWLLASKVMYIYIYIYVYIYIYRERERYRYIYIYIYTHTETSGGLSQRSGPPGPRHATKTHSDNYITNTTTYHILVIRIILCILCIYSMHTICTSYTMYTSDNLRVILLITNIIITNNK